jgi:hypothetical protein
MICEDDRMMRMQNHSMSSTFRSAKSMRELALEEMRRGSLESLTLLKLLYRGASALLLAAALGLSSV